MSAAAAAGGVCVVLNREGIRIPVAAARLVAASERTLRHAKVRHALVSITLLTPARMATLNRTHLGHRGATDVITFGFRDPEGAVIGDTYICPAVAAVNAKRFGVPVREELLRLAVHGTLHVLGHDHPEGEARVRSPMWKLQERIVAAVLRA